MAQPIVAARRGLNRLLDPVTSRTARVMHHPIYRWGGIALALIIAITLPYWQSQGYQIDAANEAEVFVLLALGLNIVVGYAGLLDLGYAAFFAIGSLTMAWLASPHFTVQGHSFSSPLISFGPQGIFVNFYLMLIIGPLAAAFCGVLFGAPTLRLRGDYLAIVTLGFGEIVPRIMQNLGPNNIFGWPDITGGINAIVGIESPPPIHLPGKTISFTGTSLRPFYYLGLALIILSVLAIISMRNSRLGRAWAAIREDEIAAAHMGINITRTRLLAFGLGAAFAGFAGVLEASRLGSVYYTSFSFSVSITILVCVILGGLGSIPGVIIGAIIISYLNILWLADIQGWIHQVGSGTLGHGPGFIGSIGHWMANVNLTGADPLLLGIILLVTMLLRPQGLWPSSTRAQELQPETEDILVEEDQQLYTARTE